MRSHSLLLLAIAFSKAVRGEDFGMKQTTESLKTKENLQYQFHYLVKDDTTGDYKTQEETKEGDSVQGSYTLAEPNGDLRKVTYKAGPGKGFEAKVDVHPNASPMKQTSEKAAVLETATNSTTKTGKTVNGNMTLESNIKHFPGGFIIDVLSKPQPDIKTEMGVKFSLKANSVTVPVTDSTNAVNFTESKATEEPQTTPEVTQTTNGSLVPDNFESLTVENSTVAPERREINEDPIEKEIDEAINSMPKLPELVLSDNKTHFKFYKDPEEALLDERITQIARQLAETSLRREYEERKLGHFIPISVSAIEPSTTSYLSKSFKFSKPDSPNFRPSEPSPLNVLTQLRLIPQYVYKQTLIPRISPVNHRLPVVSRPEQKAQQWEQQTAETIKNPPDILKINKLENPAKKVNKYSNENQLKYSATYETTDPQPISVIPVQVPTFFQFFSPYVMHTPASYVTPKQPEFYPSALKKDLTTGEVSKTDDSILYTEVTAVNDQQEVKP